jgi:hypothetical protein
MDSNNTPSAANKEWLRWKMHGIHPSKHRQGVLGVDEPLQNEPCTALDLPARVGKTRGTQMGMGSLGVGGLSSPSWVHDDGT